MWDIIAIYDETRKIPDRLVFELADADRPLSDGFVTKCSVDGIRFAAYSSAFLNPLTTKGSLLYLKTQSVPRCKHFSSGL